MLSFIKGIVASVDMSCAVVECGGIGYELIASSRCLDTLTVGSEVKLYTRLVLREDSIALYGFKDNAERDMFERLTTVSGIGPKLAIAVLSGIDAQALASCVATQNIVALSGIKGVGKKTAERILLELKGKIKAEAITLSESDSPVESPVGNDAMLALMALGYSSPEAVTALSRIEGKEKMSVEEIVMAALRS